MIIDHIQRFAREVDENGGRMLEILVDEPLWMCLLLEVEERALSLVSTSKGEILITEIKLATGSGYVRIRREERN